MRQCSVCKYFDMYILHTNLGKCKKFNISISGDKNCSEFKHWHESKWYIKLWNFLKG